MLCSRDWHNTVNQLYFSFKKYRLQSLEKSTELSTLRAKWGAGDELRDARLPFCLSSQPPPPTLLRVSLCCWTLPQGAPHRCHQRATPPQTHSQEKLPATCLLAHLQHSQASCHALWFKFTLPLVPVRGLHTGRGCQCPTGPKGHQGSLMASTRQAGPPSA